MNPWYPFLVALGLVFVAAAFMLNHAPAKGAALVLGIVSFLVAAIMALPVLHL
jgi:hypothetical protein